MSNKPKVPFFKSFFRAQITAVVATAVDFMTLFILQNFKIISTIFSMPLEKALLISTGIASILGALVSFLLGRHWAFERADKDVYGQAFKYACASLLIAAINVVGMEWLSNQMGNPYMLSKIIIATASGIFVSFPLFRYWVYK